jgi:hypothetical protein
LPPEEAVAWFHGLASGVAYLHDHGIVHRDLKPGNIFYDEGIVKVGDYGLSKFISYSRRSGHTESVGTVHYMAPEVAHGRYGKELDVYGLGIILYELLTGRVPFDGESVGEVLMKHLTAVPDVSMIAEPFRGVIARALEKDPDLRFRSAAEMLAAMPAPTTGLHYSRHRMAAEPMAVEDNDRGMASTRTQPSPPPRPRHKAIATAWVVATGLLVVILAASAAMLLWPAKSAPLQITKGSVKASSDTSSDTLQEGSKEPLDFLKTSSLPHEKSATEAAIKNEDAYSQAVATRTVGLLRAISQGLSRIVVEADKNLAEKKNAPVAVSAVAVKRPDWVDEPPKWIADGAYQMSITVGPFANRTECVLKMPDALHEASNRYVTQCLDGDADSGVRLLVDGNLRWQIVKDNWWEPSRDANNPTIRLHMLLRFDRSLKDRIVEENRLATTKLRRLQWMLALAACGLVFLTGWFGYRKINARQK